MNRIRKLTGYQAGRDFPYVNQVVTHDGNSWQITDIRLGFKLPVKISRIEKVAAKKNGRKTTKNLIVSRRFSYDDAVKLFCGSAQ